MSYDYEYLREAEDYFRDIAVVAYHTNRTQPESFLDVGCGESLVLNFMNPEVYDGFDNQDVCLQKDHPNPNYNFFVSDINSLDQYHPALKSEYDCLLFIGVPFLLNEDVLRRYVARFNPKQVLIAGIESAKEKIDGITGDLELTEVRIGWYPITRVSYKGKTPEELNRRFIYLFNNPKHS